METSSANGRQSLMDIRFDESLYKGHRVVAMPTQAFGGLSVRDVVLSQKERRSTSAGTTERRNSGAGQTQTRSRDIVQDVYDRIGVGYTRGRAHDGGLLSDIVPPPESQATAKTSEKFQQRYRSAAANSRATGNSESRGRSTEPRNIDEKEARPRSRSRGRSVTERWPPAASGDRSNITKDRSNSSYKISQHPQEYSEAKEERQSLPLSPTTASKPVISLQFQTSQLSPREMNLQGPLSPMNDRQLNSPTSKRGILNVKERPGQPPMSPVKHSMLSPTQKSFINAFESRSPPLSSSSARDVRTKRIPPPVDHGEEKKEAEDNYHDSGDKDNKSVGGMSIKDRISAYTGNTNKSVSRQNLPPRYSVQISKRDFPSKIDKYAENVEKRDSDETCLKVQTSEQNKNLNTSITDGSATELSKQRNSHNSQTKSSGRSFKSEKSVADAFLASINAPKESSVAPPMSVIAAANLTEVGETMSTTSSVSGEEFLSSPIASTAMSRKSGWQDRARQSYGTRAGYSIGSGFNQGSFQANPEGLEKMIDERVSKTIGDMERRMEGQLQRWLSLMDAKITERLDKMESKVNEIRMLAPKR